MLGKILSEVNFVQYYDLCNQSTVVEVLEKFIRSENGFYLNIEKYVLYVC